MDSSASVLFDLGVEAHFCNCGIQASLKKLPSRISFRKGDCHGERPQMDRLMSTTVLLDAFQGARDDISVQIEIIWS
ncbi:hypothetical protein CJ030_MR2G011235 [Morella rubra]|uniref:Uncharacterized protein n=1 Tax=Morella rubra TaxID=262757 RepID=A0A6A1WKZ8_9ROSI|nr:hypothetical protein CJ030_MR2G011235 [Morella rubra]